MNILKVAKYSPIRVNTTVFVFLAFWSCFEGVVAGIVHDDRLLKSLKH